MARSQESMGMVIDITVAAVETAFAQFRRLAERMQMIESLKGYEGLL